MDSTTTGWPCPLSVARNPSVAAHIAKVPLLKSRHCHDMTSDVEAKLNYSNSPVVYFETILTANVIYLSFFTDTKKRNVRKIYCHSSICDLIVK